MNIIENAKREHELMELELKKHYNKTLQRIKDGEKYFKENGYDSNFVGYCKLVREANAILTGITRATDEEIENGFVIKEGGT